MKKYEVLVDGVRVAEVEAEMETRARQMARKMGYRICEIKEMNVSEYITNYNKLVLKLNARDEMGKELNKNDWWVDMNSEVKHYNYGVVMTLTEEEYEQMMDYARFVGGNLPHFETKVENGIVSIF